MMEAEGNHFGVIMTLSGSDILEAIERSGVAHSVYSCHWSKMRLVEHPHAVVTESDLPCPFFNNVFSANVPAAGAETVVDDLADRFRARDLPCFWWSGPVNHDKQTTGILETRGFVKAFEAAAMARSVDGLAVPDSAPADVLEVHSDSEMTDWTGTCAAAFEFDNDLSVWWHDLFTSIPCGGSSPLRHYLAQIDGKPVGTASAFIEDDVVGLASVGVRAAYRRLGIGSALTLTALKRAQELGCRLGVLFSSAMAEPMYRRLGFRQYGTGHCYGWSPEKDKQQR